VTFAIYAQVVGHQFITLDDRRYSGKSNGESRCYRAGLAWAFTTFHATNWHPLTWISHMIDCQLFGTNAGPHLLSSALIHVANTLLVFWFLLRTTRARWPSALVAALFCAASVARGNRWLGFLNAKIPLHIFRVAVLIRLRALREAPSISRYAWVAITLALDCSPSQCYDLAIRMLLLDYWR